MIAVTGASGRQGSAVMRALADTSMQAVGLSRFPKNDAMRFCDLEDAASIRSALAGVDALFLTTTPYESGIDAEERQARNALEAARAAGVRQIIYSSVADARSATGVDHYESKGRVEAILENAGFDMVTILRPTFFMDMFLGESFRRALASGCIEMAMRPDSRIAMIAVDDIAAFARLAFEKPEQLKGEIITLAGDMPGMADVADAMAKALGKPITYRQVAPADMPADVRPKLGTQRWFEARGWQVDSNALARRYGLPLTDLQQWAFAHVAQLGGI